MAPAIAWGVGWRGRIRGKNETSQISLLKAISLKAPQRVSVGHPLLRSVGPMLVFLHPGSQGAAAVFP